MQTHRTKASVADNGAHTVEELPYPAGKSIEVVVIPINDQRAPSVSPP